MIFFSLFIVTLSYFFLLIVYVMIDSLMQLINFLLKV